MKNRTSKNYFDHIPSIGFEGKESNNPFAFKYYNASKKVMGKSMARHFKFACAYWHSFCNTGGDPFGSGTKIYPWLEADDPMERAYDKMDAAFEFMNKIGLEYFCFHDYDLVDETIIETGQIAIAKPGEYHEFEALENSICYEIYWVELNHQDIQRESVGGMPKKK